jgi:hypothetical protein
MHDRDRLKQLRALRDQLTRLPPSPDRDRMLREVGSRAVDLESSERSAVDQPRSPKPDAPADPPAHAAPAEHRPQRARRAPATARRTTRGEAGRVRSRADAADAFTASVRPTAELPEGLLLSLDDLATPAEPSHLRPWTRGLRG